jgi:hypothetical protein
MGRRELGRPSGRDSVILAESTSSRSALPRPAAAVWLLAVQPWAAGNLPLAAGFRQLGGIGDGLIKFVSPVLPSQASSRQWARSQPWRRRLSTFSTRTAASGE